MKRDFEIVLINARRRTIRGNPESREKQFASSNEAIVKPFGLRMIMAAHDDLAAWRQGYNKPVTSKDIVNSAVIPISLNSVVDRN